MIFYRVLWYFCLLMFTIAFFFFLEGLGTAISTPDLNFYLAWFLILGILGGTMLGGAYFKSKNRLLLAKLMLAGPALLGCIYLLWIILALGSEARWN